MKEITNKLEFTKIKNVYSAKDKYMSKNTSGHRLK